MEVWTSTGRIASLHQLEGRVVESFHIEGERVEAEPFRGRSVRIHGVFAQELGQVLGSGLLDKDPFLLGLGPHFACDSHILAPQQHDLADLEERVHSSVTPLALVREFSDVLLEDVGVFLDSLRWVDLNDTVDLECRDHAARRGARLANRSARTFGLAVAGRGRRLEPIDEVELHRRRSGGKQGAIVLKHVIIPLINISVDQTGNDVGISLEATRQGRGRLVLQEVGFEPECRRHVASALVIAGKIVDGVVVNVIHEIVAVEHYSVYVLIASIVVAVGPGEFAGGLGQGRAKHVAWNTHGFLVNVNSRIQASCFFTEV